METATTQRHFFGRLFQIARKYRGRLLGIFGEGVPPGSPSPDPISDQAHHFPYLFSDLAMFVRCHRLLCNCSNLFNLNEFSRS